MLFGIRALSRILMAPEDAAPAGGGGAPAGAAPAVAAPAAPVAPAPAPGALPNGWQHAAPQAAPVPIPAAPVAPAVAVPAAPAAAVEEPPADPDWFKKRAEKIAKNAREDLLKELGVKNVDEAKTHVTTSKKSEDEKKTEIQKATDKVKELEPQAARATHLEAVIKERATAELSALTEQQKATVEELAGTDPAAQLQTIDRLRKGGLLTAPAPVAAPAAAPAAGAAAPAARAPVAPAASTTGAGGAPPPASASTPNHKTVYEQLQTTNPVAAAAYSQRYEREIFGG